MSETGQPAESASAGTNGPLSKASDDAWQRLIYVPFRNLRRILDDEKATVILPYEEYLKLWERAAAAPPTPPKKGPDAVATAVHFTVQVEKQIARVQADLSVRVLGHPWTALPLQLHDVAVAEVSSDDGDVMLRAAGKKGTYQLLFAAPGEYSVRLEFSTRIQSSPEGRRFEFPTPAVPVTTLEVAIPEEEQQIEIEPKPILLPSEPLAGGTRVRARLGATDGIAVQWHPKAERKPDMELLVSADNQLQVNVEPGRLHSVARLEYTVLRGETSELRLAVPSSARVLDVIAPEAPVKGWRVEPAPGRKTVLIEFLRPLRGNFAVEVQTERPLPEGVFQPAGIADDGTVYGIHAADAVREQGRLAVAATRELSLVIESQQRLVQIDAADVPESMRRHSARYYRFYSPQFQLRAAVSPIQPRLFATSRTRISVTEGNQWRVQSVLHYRIERAGVFNLRVRIPQGLSVDDVVCEGLREYALDETTGVLTLTFDERRMGELSATVNLHGPIESMPAEALTLPVPQPLDVVREQGSIAVYAAESLEVITDDESVVAAQPDPAPQAESLPGLRLVSAWTFTRRPVTVPVSIRRRPTRLTAQVGTVVDIQRETVHAETLVVFVVEFAALDTFRIAVPENVADAVEIQLEPRDGLPPIKQRSRSEPDEDGWVTWTISLQRPATGRIPFRLQYDLAVVENDAEADADEPPAGEAAEATPASRRIVVTPARALDAGEQAPLRSLKGELAVRRDPALTVSAAVLTGEAEPIDVRELELLPPTAFLAFRYFKQPVGFELTATVREVQPVVATVVNRALVEIALGRDRTAHYRCRFRLRTTERQRLPIELPRTAVLLGASVNGRDVGLDRPEGDSDAADAPFQTFLVDVGRTEGPDESLLLTVQFRMALEGLFESPIGPVRLALPRLGQGTAAVQNLRVALWVPEGFTLVGKPENFVRETPYFAAGLGRRGGSQDDLDTWIGASSGGTIEFPRSGRELRFANLGGADTFEIYWWRSAFATWVLSGAVVVMAWVLRNTSWENRLSWLLLLAFVAALASLAYADWVVEAIAASAIGLVVMLGLWIVHGVFRVVRYAAVSMPARKRPVTTSVPPVVPPPGVFDELHGST